jgi:hypothetical protein
MLIDPVTVAASAPNPALSLAIVNQDGFGSERRDTNGGGYSSIINHAKIKDGERHYFQLLLEKDVTDPYTSLVRRKKASASVSMTMPVGFSTTEMINLCKALFDTIADADVTTTKLLQWQS